MVFVKGKWTLFLGSVLFVGLISLALLMLVASQVRSSESIVHPDAVQKARRVLITLKSLDSMATLPGDIAPLPEVVAPRTTP